MTDFPFEIDENCEYPDTTFTLLFKDNVTDEIKQQAESEFYAFQQDWDLKHTDGIHNIMIDENVPETCGNKSVQIIIDFGNCDPKIIIKLIQWLKKSELPIEKVIVS